MDGSAIVHLFVVYREPPRQKLRPPPGCEEYFRLLTCATTAAYDAP